MARSNAHYRRRRCKVLSQEQGFLEKKWKIKMMSQVLKFLSLMTCTAYSLCINVCLMYTFKFFPVIPILAWLPQASVVRRRSCILAFGKCRCWRVSWWAKSSYFIWIQFYGCTVGTLHVTYTLIMWRTWAIQYLYIIPKFFFFSAILCFRLLKRKLEREYRK